MPSLPRTSSRLPRAGTPEEKHAIHPAEKTVTILLALWTSFQPWAFGTMHVWSQSIALALAALAFAASLYPRQIVIDERVFRIAPWRLLVRLPLFWLTVAVLVYAAVQAINPGWAYRQSLTHWWLERQPATPWLPSGIEAPFERMNAWRKIVIWSSPLLAGCAIWLAITRRRSARALLVIFIMNATLVGIYAIVQQAAGMREIFWRFEFPHTAGPFGSFVYKNHAAAYLLVAFAAACGLAVSFFIRGVARGARSTPAPVLGFLAITIGTATVFSLSRLGAVLTAFAVVLQIAAYGWAFRRELSGQWKIPLAVVLILTVIAGAAATQLNTAKIEKGLSRLALGVGESSPKIRVYTYHFTLKMINDHTLWGVGAGGFRYLAPAYHQEFPAISQSNSFGGSRKWKSVRTYGVNETHSEPLELAAEFGVVGGVLLAALVAFALAAVTRAARAAQPITLASLIAFLCVGAFSALDFPLHSPAVVAALVLMGTLSCRLSQIEAGA